MAASTRDTETCEPTSLTTGPRSSQHADLTGNAAVARHRVDPPRLGIDSDPAWRATALLHTLALLKPLPSANARFACATAVAYMFVSGVGIDPPYGALVDLARDLISGKTDVYGAADRLRSWQI